MTELARAIVASLLVMFPYFHTQVQRTRFVRRQDQIAAQAASAAQEYGVPVALVLASAFLETHCGCDTGDADWGAPRDRLHPWIAGGPRQHASSLAFGKRDCPTWLGAMHHYRVGLCNGHERVGYTAEQALRLAERLMVRVGEPLPEYWR
jgi:hypothetical protein